MKRSPGWIIGLGALAWAATALTGCAGPPVRIAYETTSHLNTSTGDRLYRVRASEVGALFLKPGIQFAEYGSVAFRSVTLGYAEPPMAPSVLDRDTGNYRLGHDAAERIKLELREALASELGRDGGFDVLPEPSEDTLVISPHIVNLRWETPLAQGGESLFVRRNGSMVLVLDLRDAETGALVARLVDPAQIRPIDLGITGAYESRPVNDWAGVRDVCTRWGWILSGTLASLSGLPPLAIP